MYKKAQLMMSGRKWISLIIGLLLTALGVLPLLKSLNVIPFGLPAIPGLVLWILFVIGGIWLMVDAASEGTLQAAIMWPSLIVGIIILGLGVIPLLTQVGVISLQLSFMTQMVSNIVTTIAGLLLISGGTFGGF